MIGGSEPMTETALPSDAQLRELAREILERDEYAQHRVDELAQFRIAQWIAEQLRALLGWIDGLRDVSPGLYWVFVAALAVLALALFAHMVWSLRVALRPPVIEATELAPQRSRDFRAEAEALAARGGYLEAARRYQLGCLQLLLERGVLELERADPNRILRSRLAAAPLPVGLRDTFRGLIDRLEAQWFRDRENDPELYRAWRELHAALGARAGVGTA